MEIFQISQGQFKDNLLFKASYKISITQKTKDNFYSV